MKLAEKLIGSINELDAPPPIDKSKNINKGKIDKIAAQLADIRDDIRDHNDAIKASKGSKNMARRATSITAVSALRKKMEPLQRQLKSLESK